jgi:hypothetical protein
MADLEKPRESFSIIRKIQHTLGDAETAIAETAMPKLRTKKRTTVPKSSRLLFT